MLARAQRPARALCQRPRDRPRDNQYPRLRARARGSSPSRPSSPPAGAPGRCWPSGAEAKRWWVVPPPISSPCAPSRWRDRGLRSGGEHAPLLYPQGTRPVPFHPRPRVIIGVPSGVTEVEKRAVQDAAPQRRLARGLHDRGADGRRHRRRAAHPRGGGEHDRGRGGGTTEVAVISLAGRPLALDPASGGDKINRQISAVRRRGHDLYIGSAPPR